MNTTSQLQQHYIDRLLNHLTARDMPRKQFIVWQVIFDTQVCGSLQILYD